MLVKHSSLTISSISPRLLPLRGFTPESDIMVTIRPPAWHLTIFSDSFLLHIFEFSCKIYTYLFNFHSGYLPKSTLIQCDTLSTNCFHPHTHTHCCHTNYYNSIVWKERWWKYLVKETSTCSNARVKWPSLRLRRAWKKEIAISYKVISGWKSCNFVREKYDTSSGSQEYWSHIGSIHTRLNLLALASM